MERMNICRMQEIRRDLDASKRGVSACMHMHVHLQTPHARARARGFCSARSLRERAAPKSTAVALTFVCSFKEALVFVLPQQYP
jgi:hypothetical protein